jgi:hypothetical protein
MLYKLLDKQDSSVLLNQVLLLLLLPADEPILA